MLVVLPIETGDCITLQLCVFIPKALRDNPVYLYALTGSGTLAALDHIDLRVDGAVASSGVIASGGDTRLSAPYQRHEGLLHTQSQGDGNFTTTQSDTSGIVYAGRRALLEQHVLETESVRFYGGEGLSLISHLLHTDTATHLLSYARAVDGRSERTLSQRIAAPSILSGGNGPLFIGGRGDKVLTGPLMHAAQAIAITGDSVTLAPATSQISVEERREQKGGTFSRGKTTHTQAHMSLSVPVSLNAPLTVIATTSPEGAATLTGVQPTGDVMVLSNDIRLESTTDTLHQSIQKTSTSAVVNRTSSSQITREIHTGCDLSHLTTLPHDPTFHGRITAPLVSHLQLTPSEDAPQLPAPSTSSSSVVLSERAIASSSSPVAPPEGLVLPAVSVPEITVPSDLSDMKVHLTVTDAMHTDPQVQDFIARTGAIVTRTHDTFEDIHTSQGSLGAPLCVVLSVGINFVLPGGGALMTAASAVAATLIPRFVNGLMLHGDLAGALKECTNASALKAIVLSLVVPRGGAPAGSIDLVKHFVAAFQNAVARLPFEYALGEGDFRTSVQASFLGAASDTVTGFVASHIGALSHPGGSSEGGIPVPLSLGLHAANGAAGAAIRGEDPLSGAMGAAMGEAAGMIYHHVRMRGLRPGTEEYDRALSVGANVARMAAALASIPLDLDADTAARAAGTAAENNALGAIPAVIATVAEALATAEGAVALTAGAGATGLALQHGIESMQNNTNAPGYDPYNDVRNSSSSAPADRLFGDDPNTGSVLFQASPASSSSSSSGPNFYESLYHLPSTLGMTPAPSLPSLPGFTPHRSWPSVYSTPSHVQPVIPSWTPGYFGRPSVTSTPSFGGKPLTLSTPIHNAGPSILLRKNKASSSQPDTSEPRQHVGASGPISAPEVLPAFPDACWARPKTPKQNGGGLRKRWTTRKNIFEWDSQHETVEKYCKRGKHLGEFDPYTGRQLKPADPTRRIKP